MKLRLASLYADKTYFAKLAFCQKKMLNYCYILKGTDNCNYTRANLHGTKKTYLFAGQTNDIQHLK
jgi:hypothetical protein